MDTRSEGNICPQCQHEPVPQARIDLGYITCLRCGEKQARAVRHCIVPLHKSNYFVCTDPADLHGINNKGGLVK